MSRHRSQVAELCIRDIRRTALLSRDTEQELVRAVQAATTEAERRAAMAPLLAGNLRLILSIARRFEHTGYPIHDMVQDGVFGVIQAAERFDPERGHRFATYATWWIRLHIQRGVEQQRRTVRVPMSNKELQRKIRKARDKLRGRDGAEPSRRAIADELGIPVADVERSMRIYSPTTSLDEPVSRDESVRETKADRLRDERAGAAEVVEAHDLSRSLDEALATLPGRHARVVRMRTGFGVERSYSLQEIGNELGVTRERVRQIEKASMKRLRERCERRGLDEWLTETPQARAVGY